MALIPPFERITGLIGRGDIGEEIAGRFTEDQQLEMLEVMKKVMVDELIFVMSWKETELRRQQENRGMEE